MDGIDDLWDLMGGVPSHMDHRSHKAETCARKSMILSNAMIKLAILT